jgi:hypothetical protein
VRLRRLLPVVVTTALERSPSLGLHDVQQVADQLVFARFGVFLGRKRSGTGLGRKFPYPILVGLVKVKGQNILRGFRRKRR